MIRRTGPKEEEVRIHLGLSQGPHLQVVVVFEADHALLRIL